MKQKIFITGTGRCGTTFLIKLFSFLKMETGFTKNNYIHSISKNCNSGLERAYTSNYKYLKNPCFIIEVDEIYSKFENNIVFIVPVRSFEESAKSRESHGHANGGFFNAKNFDEQLSFYHKSLSEFMLKTTKYDIEVIFLDFARMISDKKYLYMKLQDILDHENISYDQFVCEYEDATLSSKPSMKKDL